MKYLIFFSVFYTIICDTESSKDIGESYNTLQLISYNGYPAEAHSLVTDDGYIIELHRIPYSKKHPELKPQKTVFLQHGLEGSSFDWVVPDGDKCLAYVLSDIGYDVWMGNARGNQYSKAHTFLSVGSDAFWNFSWHDISQHDLPSMIDYIRDHKGDIKLDYIGHSMGTTMLFALLSTKTEYNKVIQAGYALAPVAFMSHVFRPLKLMASFISSTSWILKILGNRELNINSYLKKALEKFCAANNIELHICETLALPGMACDKTQLNSTLMPRIITNKISGASTKTILHYFQIIANNNGSRFQQFDYGQKGNMIEYGTPEPPEYPIKKISVPIALFSGKSDQYATVQDVHYLSFRLANVTLDYVVPLDGFNHNDFLWAIDAPTLFFNKLTELMRKINNT